MNGTAHVAGRACDAAIVHESEEVFPDPGSGGVVRTVGRVSAQAEDEVAEARSCLAGDGVDRQISSGAIRGTESSHADNTRATTLIALT